MIVFPAMDIKGGKCVRLLKGDFDKVTQYEKSPIAQATHFFNLGFKNLSHLILIYRVYIKCCVYLCKCRYTCICNCICN